MMELVGAGEDEANQWLEEVGVVEREEGRGGIVEARLGKHQ